VLFKVFSSLFGNRFKMEFTYTCVHGRRSIDKEEIPIKLMKLLDKK
jgi:hypothetical protein